LGKVKRRNESWGKRGRRRTQRPKAAEETVDLPHWIRPG
jgi:hypothetical protein